MQRPRGAQEKACLALDQGTKLLPTPSLHPTVSQLESQKDVPNPLVRRQLPHPCVLPAALRMMSRLVSLALEPCCDPVPTE